MARRTSNKEEPLIDPEIPSQEEDEFYRFLEEVGPSTAMVDVFRLKRDGSRPHVTRVTPDVLSDDVYSFLRSLSPEGGRYMLCFMSSSRRYLKSKTIEVGPSENATPANGTQPARSDDGVMFLRDQLAQQQTLLLALIANLGQNKGPDLSFLAGVLKPPDMTPVVTLMSAMINRKPEGGMDGVQLAKTIVDLSKDIGGGSDHQPDSFWGFAKDIGKTLAGGLSSGSSAQLPAPVYSNYPVQVTQQMPPQVPQLPPPVVHNPAPPQTPQPQTPEETMKVNQATFVHWLRAGLVQLKGKAAQGKDVELWAEIVVDNTEEPQWSAVAGAVQQGAKFTDLLQFDPEIAQNPQLKGWFENFYNALHAEIFNDVDSAGAGGNPPDAAGHAGPSPAGPVAAPGSAAVPDSE
jgi:hypothetical protein